MSTSEIVAYVSLAVSVAGIVLGVINHKRVRSKCCGHNLEASFDVENTTPPDSLRISVPPASLEKLDDTTRH